MLFLYGVMWLMFGIGAIITAFLNIIWAGTEEKAKKYRFLSLSLTALTLCSFYSQVSVWVAHEDWGALLDVVPSISAALWILTISSVVINSVSLFKSKNR